MIPARLDPLPGRRPVRRALAAVGLLVAFRFLFEWTWPQTAVLVGVVLVAESGELTRTVPRVDARHARVVLGLLVVVIGIGALYRGSDTQVAAVAGALGGWLLLDGLYGLRAGIRPAAPDEEELSSGETLLVMQVGRLVAEELKSGPRTVPELADACDMTESRVEDALRLHERAGTVSRHGDTYHLVEENVGPWPFVRNGVRSLVGRLARPFRLFVPS